MYASVLQSELSKNLKLASRFVSSRAQLPILANIKLLSEGAHLGIQATNLEMSFSTQVGAKNATEGEITIPARTLTDLVNTIRGDTVELESKEEQLSVSSGEMKANISGMNATEFPEIPTQNPKEGIVLDFKSFQKALNQVLFSASIDDTRPALSGVLFIFQKGKLILVSSDGFRLSRKVISIKSDQFDDRVIVPKGILLEISRLPEVEEKISLTLDKNNNQVLFSFGNIILASRVIEGEYPNFEKIIPTSFKTKVSIEREDLVDGVKQSAVFAREGSNIIKLQVNKDYVGFSAESSGSGKQEGKLDAKIDGDEVEISFNYRYLEDFLGVLDSSGIDFSLIDSTTAGVFTPSGDESYLHLIMPVKS